MAFSYMQYHPTGHALNSLTVTGSSMTTLAEDLLDEGLGLPASQSSINGREIPEK